MSLSGGPVSTTDDNAVTLIANAAGKAAQREVNVVNPVSGSGEGLISVDGGTTYPYYLPAGPSSRRIGLSQRTAVVVKIKRTAGGTNITGAYGDAD